MIDRSHSSGLAIFATLLLASACNDSRASTVRNEQQSAESLGGSTKALADAPIAKYRIELLDLAFEAASSFPIDPHIKNRSRAQEAVILTCFQLGQLKRVRGYIDRVDNWRKGAALADFANECWIRGDRARAEDALQKATEVAESCSKDLTAQAWRPSRILAKVARVYLLMGEKDQASGIARKVIATETGPMDAALVDGVERSGFDDALKDIDATLLSGDFDQVRNALSSCVRMFDRFYGDADRRALLEDRVRHGYEKLPLDVRITLILDLARSCLRKQDSGKARELILAAQAHLNEADWLPRQEIPLQCQIAVLQEEAAQPEKARKQVARALGLYEKKRESVYDIYRAGLLRPIAEALVALGDTAQALQLYKMAADAGMENPNSRPRCDDLVATCCSLARNGFEPDAELKAKLIQNRKALGQPW